MEETADVVVVGGGAVGASAAWHLRQRGVGRVVLVERQTLASGSTGKAAGGIRTQFADELNVRIALRSLDELERMEGIGFRQYGYLFLLGRQEDVTRFQEALALQHRLGVPSRELSVDEALELVPQLSPKGLLAATFCELDGYATPEAVVHWYARDLDVRQGWEVTAIDTRGSRITVVETSKGSIATDTVVCCAGIWSKEVGAMVGLDIPVRGERRFVFFTPHDGGLPERLPLTIDFSTGFYFHREGQGIAFGGREQTLEELARPATRRLPALAELGIHSSWWGYYDVSPDWNAIVGEASEPSRFLYATGFSGHGFQQAPAVGEYLAELVVGARPTLDLSPFALERFAGGERRPELFVV
ncbi:MAG: sarcosine oxidase subunit beta [Thermoleophilia bacterium]